MDQAEQFRSAYDLTTNGTQRETQKSLIDEEWSEFHEAYFLESEECQLKELADLVGHVKPRRLQKPGFNPATLTFQAIRIVVNDELNLTDICSWPLFVLPNVN